MVEELLVCMKCGRELNFIDYKFDKTANPYQIVAVFDCDCDVQKKGE